MSILSNGHQWKLTEFVDNKKYSFDRDQILNSLTSKDIDDAFNSISKWEGYSPTPLIKLNKLSRELNLKNIFYKDENRRFNLKSFKALGGAYAIEKVTKGNKEIIVATATAGNHGRSVAWGAKRLGLKCKIFVSQYVSDSRVKEIKKFGAEVIRVKGDYENSLNECKKLSKKNNWKIVQDVATRDYKLVPQLTMAGYSIMIREISKQTNQYITHIFLQAGVGGMAAGVVAGVAKYFKRIPKIIIVEPDRADCVLQSIKSRKLKKIKIKKESIMGGMSCNEMSYIPWQILKKASNHCVSVSDRNVAKTVALLKDKKLSKNSIIGGECSAPGIISLVSVCNDLNTKKLIKLNEKSNVLIIGCEGNADVKLYKQLLSKGRK